MIKIETYLPKVFRQVRQKTMSNYDIPVELFKAELMRVTSLRRQASIVNELEALRLMGYIKIDENHIQLCDDIYRPYEFYLSDAHVEK